MVSIYTKIPTDAYDKILAKAKRESRSLASQIAIALMAYASRLNDKTKPIQ